MDMIFHITSWALLVTGGVFGVIGGIGMLRMPDFYTRTHAASVTDTMGAGCIILGLCLQAGWSLILAKLIFILVFLFFTSPTASHAIAKAAYLSGLKPDVKKHLKGSKLAPDATMEGENQ